jgi:hypothetical protein
VIDLAGLSYCDSTGIPGRRALAARAGLHRHAGAGGDGDAGDAPVDGGGSGLLDLVEPGDEADQGPSAMPAKPAGRDLRAVSGARPFREVTG